MNCDHDDNNNRLVCIRVNQVFSACQERDCPTVDTGIDAAHLADVVRIEFKNGVIESEPVLTPIPGKPDCFRAQYDVTIYYRVVFKTNTSPWASFDVPKDIILYIPRSQARTDFPFEIVVETHTEVLGAPFAKDGHIQFLAGVLIVNKVIGEVQLQVRAEGHCPEPCECVDFIEQNLCEEFRERPFPENFFPPFPTDLCPPCDDC